MVTHHSRPLEHFVAGEHERYNAYREICNVLADFHTRGCERAWPVQVLPVIADVTFSDGAAFVIAGSNGSMEIRQESARAPGNIVKMASLDRGGDLWRKCVGEISLRILNSHLTQAGINDLGVDLPVRSSLMAEHLGCRPACICVWRSPGGGREHSIESYQFYDVLPLQLACQMTSLTIELISHLNEIVRLRSIRKSMAAVLDIIQPKLIGLNEIARQAPRDIASQLVGRLAAFEAAIEELRQRQMAEQEG